MNNFFENIFAAIQKNKILSFSVFLVVFAVLLNFALRVQLEEDIAKIIPKGDQNDLTVKTIQQLNFSDKIAVMLHLENSENEEALVESANIFLARLESHEQHYLKIQGQVEMDQIDEVFDFVYDHLSLFLDSSDYQVLSLRLQADSISNRIQQNYNTLISPTGMLAKNFLLKDPLGLTFLGMNKLRSIGISDEFQIKDGFITSVDGRTILLFITPTHSGTDTEKNEDFVGALQTLQDELNAQFKNEVVLTYFGAPFIALANAQQIKSDIQRTVVISLSVLLLLLIVFYRNILVPLILFIPVVFGAVFSAACIYFLKDSVSAISLSIGAVLLGITLDYPLHIITHSRAGCSVSEFYKHITKPIISSSLTTASAFMCLLFVNSEVLQDLGLFAAISVLASACCALIFVPHLYAPKTSKNSQKNKKHFIDKLAQASPHNNKWAFGLSILLILFGLFTYSKVNFNNNLADLNFVPQEMKESEKQLESLGSIGAKSIYLACYGKDIEKVLDDNHNLEQKLNSLKAEGKIEDYTSMGQFVISKRAQQEKNVDWKRFWNEERVANVSNHLNTSANAVGFKEGVFENVIEDFKQGFQVVSLAEFLDFELLSVNDFFSEREGFYTFSSIVKIDESKKEELFKTLENEDVIIIDRKLLNEQFLGQLRDDFIRLMNLSFAVIFVIMLLFFRRLELALLSMIPIVFTGLITAGVMAVFGIEFNVFSTIVITLILGLGIDFSIFMTSGLQMRHTTGKDELPVYRTSILLAVITTVLALGTLIFAKHPALTSISFASLIGVLAALFMTFVFYPKIFHWVIELRSEKGKAPASLRLLVGSVISYIFYASLGILYGLFGVVFIKLIPINKEIKLRYYRKVIARFIKSVMFSNYGLTNKVVKQSNEAFDKPAIIIANHSSFLDTLSMGFINTPFIFLVNDWVYKSPVFGKAVQLAGYYPVSEGLENGEDRLLEFIKQGYSLMIFPEGTRSIDGVIGRFHKGAFYLAKKYDIDILPVYIHGNSQLIPKNDFIIYDGRHTLTIGKRISPSEFPDQDVKTFTKTVSNLFKSQFRSLRAQLEDENYFKKKILLSFLYKTSTVKKAAQWEFESNKKWVHGFNEYIPSTAVIHRFGSDYGIIDALLCFQEPRRKVNCSMLDKNNEAIAKQSYWVNKFHIRYQQEIAQNTSVLIISTNFGQTSFDDLMNKHLFEIVVLKKDVDINWNSKDFNLTCTIDEYCLYKRVKNG
jgi:1-acyl-sn-glycerol-3-phosphate acyltransferase